MTQALEKTSNGEDYAKVMSAVRDFIFENHRFPQVNDIVDITGVQRQRCNEIIDTLVGQRKLYVVFGGEGLTIPKVVIPYEMMQGALMMQKKPVWLPNHGFVEKVQIAEKIQNLQKEEISYEQFERLLYATDIPLEEAIAYALDWLGFQNVVHHKDDSDNPDVTFDYNGTKALLEAEGTTKAGDKKKILQLNGWMQRELEAGMEASKVRGLFAVNHFRDIEPEERADPLTKHAKEFLRLYGYTHFTTPFLFETVKRVKDGALSKEDAQKLIWQGEKIR